ncbi:MAG: RIP metalloprotease RseP [Bacteroidota bacterium]
MEFLSTVFYFIVTIGILVFIHEFGHFAAAKFFGMRVDRFSIGFPPRAFGKQIGETDYCVSWIPIGGYVKIAGMVDESLDTEFLQRLAEPWEFRAKPIWQRAVVMAAGVVMNLVLAVAIFWGIIYSQGRVVRPVTEIGYVVPDSPADKAGLRTNDRIAAINDRPVTQWDQIESIIYAETLGQDVIVRVERDSATAEIEIKRLDLPDLTEERFGIYPAGLVPVVASVQSDMPGASIGLAPGDTVKSVNDERVSYASLSGAIRKNAGRDVTLAWKRGDSAFVRTVTPTSEGIIGISLLAAYQGPIERQDYSIVAAFPVSVREVWFTSGLFFNNLLQIVVGEASFSKSVGGPVRIAQMANRSAESGIVSFLGFVALLSISLALLNILPFPALDGGHLLFLGYEAVFRREIPTRIKLVVQQAGMLLLLVFMAFVLYNDLLHI